MLEQIVGFSIVFGICFFFLALNMLMTGKEKPLRSCGGAMDGGDCEFCGGDKAKCEGQAPETT